MNPYEVLGVPRNATDKQIKLAYKRRAKKLHPDVGGDPEEFLKLQHSYLVLSDPKQRSKYDNDGTIEDDIEQDGAINLLVNIFNEVLNQNVPYYVDYVHTMKQLLRKKQTEQQVRIPELEGDIKRFEQIRDRLSRKKNGNPILDQVLNNKIENCKGGIKACQESIQNYERAITILADYKFKVDTPPADLWAKVFGEKEKGE